MTSESLVVTEEEQVRKELKLPEPEAISLDDVAPELERQADELVSRFVSVDPAEAEDAEATKAAVENMGVRLQEEASHRSAMLEEPLSSMADRAEDGGEVANALIELKLKVEELDPGKYDLEPGWLSRLLGRIPGVGTPIKRYFTRFESSQTVIDAILRSLDDGKDQLQHDNATLREDQKHLRKLTHKLQRAVQLARLIDQKLNYKIERDLVDQPNRAKFVQEELLFPLRQRIMDLQQQLAVCQQGVVTLEIVMRNNKELIRGVNRAKHVTVNALQVAVTLAIALANQRIVLDKVNAVNETTNELIAGTAKRLREQGAEIHKQSASTALDVETLKGAFRDIHAALDDIARYRQEALPKMEHSIHEMAQLTESGEKKIRDMERADVAAEDVFEFIPDDPAADEADA
ncbi:MAG: toxic anion resistance protein [Xanthomonadales bacterium]|nr:toxic anion resistance protein [Xanthomonadales bacterium]